jgi:hypothetical protein
LPAALDVTRAAYAGQRASYETAEEGLAETMFGFSRGDGDFIEICINGPASISVTVELPGVRHERRVHSLSDVEALVQRYFTLSHEALRAALGDR